MADIIKNLKEKGWSEGEIKRVSKILDSAPEKKSDTILLIDKVAYWGGLFIAIIGNFAISVLLIPFLILMKSFYLYLALVFLGVVFGWVFSILLRDIEAIKTGQHIIAWIFIPAIAIINVYVMTNLSNHIATLMEIATGIHIASMVSIVYVGSFMFPYAVSKIIKG
jgi:hypothetical protein